MDGIHLGISAGPNSPLFSDDVLNRASALFDEAEKNIADKPEVLHRVRVARLPILYVQIARLLDKRKGPRQATEQESRLLQTAFDRFDSVARQEGVTMVSENRSFANWAAEVKQVLASPPR
jgi:hypothetical protein